MAASTASIWRRKPGSLTNSQTIFQAAWRVIMRLFYRRRAEFRIATDRDPCRGATTERGTGLANSLSRGAARDISPRRRPWVQVWKSTQPRQGREKRPSRTGALAPRRGCWDIHPFPTAGAGLRHGLMSAAASRLGIASDPLSRLLHGEHV